jgi:DNA (cytosine-5)-methyltransferase 1
MRIYEKRKVKQKILKAVDFFCSGGGMSSGMQQSGIKILAGIDYDNTCKETYEANIKDAKFIHKDVFEYQESELETELNLQRDDDDLILIGCSPCQFWSMINTDRNKSEKSKSLLIEFRRFVEYFNPGYVVVENVPGVLRRKDESGLEDFIYWLETNGYKVHHGVHNVMEYGVPQNRRRLTLIANRVNNNVLEPIKYKGKLKTVYDTIGEHNGFPKVQAGPKTKLNLCILLLV